MLPPSRELECLQRLAAVGLASLEPDGSYHITPFGLDMVRMNASCRDGDEGRYRPAAYWRDLRDERERGKEPPIVVDDLIASMLAYERVLAVKSGVVRPGASN